LNDLGGNNFTTLISNDILRVTCLNKTDVNQNILWNISQKIKEKLTWLDMYETNINNLIPDKVFKYSLSKTKFENMCDKLMDKVKQTLKDIITNYPIISYIILVGGTSRIPILQKTISEKTA
jgi:molecular chaperone DnaK (HSP70)